MSLDHCPRANGGHGHDLNFVSTEPAAAHIAFACGMIAHHQAAIDMVRVVLDHGQDADMRRPAEEIIEAQQEEIEYMTQWLEDSSN